MRSPIRGCGTGDGALGAPARSGQRRARMQTRAAAAPRARTAPSGRTPGPRPGHPARARGLCAQAHWWHSGAAASGSRCRSRVSRRRRTRTWRLQAHGPIHCNTQLTGTAAAQSTLEASGSAPQAPLPLASSRPAAAGAAQGAAAAGIEQQAAAAAAGGSGPSSSSGGSAGGVQVRSLCAGLCAALLSELTARQRTGKQRQRGQELPGACQLAQPARCSCSTQVCACQQREANPAPAPVRALPTPRPRRL